MNNERTAVFALHKALDAKFAKDLLILELGSITPIADYFVICTGASTPQLAALAETAEDSLTASGYKMLHSEGVGKWVLLDFGSIVVHLFDQESREYYNLERIWGDAKVIKPE